ncbi:MAG: T9SS type A sorting domain-containing protein, partial [bacterium]
LLIFAYSDEQGKSTIIVPSINADTAFLSISKRDFIPVIKKLPVLYNAPILSIRGIYLSDGTPGNFNSFLEPGEGALLRLRLVSSARIQAPVILVDSPSQYISFDTTSFALSEINEGENDIILSIRGKSGLSSGESPIYLRVIGIDGSESSVMFYIPTQGPYIEVNNIIVADTVEGSDGDGQLESGESALLWVELINNSFVNFETLLVSYSIRNGFASVNDYEPLKFISLIGRGGRRISSVPIKIKLSPLIPEGSTIEIGFWVNFSGTEQELEEYSLSVPARATYRVIGPDNYGYVCLSDMLIGVYPGAPSYSWAEVVPEFGGDGELILSSDDTVEVFELPFPLKFYGNTYTRITISSNGWVAPDSVPPFLFQFYNLPIPHPGGPWGIIAPFWDDLSPHIGGVYYYYDEPHHRIIYEWSNVPHASTGAIQTFEVIIYDANYYPTTTGDCEIVFQYKTVNDTDSEENFSTVGICSPYILDGIQYLYSRIYAPGAATIATGRALKFTTDLPLCNIFGKVTLEDGVEDVNARVYIPGGKETLTDRGGNYSLKMLLPDTSRIIATKRGYFPAETVLALVPYTTIRNVNFVLRKMPSPDSVSATKGDTNLVVSWAVREHLVPDSARIYRSQILGGNHSYIGTTSGPETSFIDTTAIPRAKYYYYVSLFYGEGESNLAGPDSGWIGSTSISEGIRTPEKISFWVYPNPFNSSLFLETNETGSYEILVHNILGNIVKTQQIKAPARVKLEFYNSPSGIYLLSLYKDKKIIEMKKILLLK